MFQTTPTTIQKSVAYFIIRNGVSQLCENTLCIQETRIDMLWSFEAATNDENFGGNLENVSMIRMNRHYGAQYDGFAALS